MTKFSVVLPVANSESPNLQARIDEIKQKIGTTTPDTSEVVCVYTTEDRAQELLEASRYWAVALCVEALDVEVQAA